MKRITSLLILALLLPSLVLGQSSGESLDASFANPTNLTDEQMTEAKDFVHQGIEDRVYKEGCEKLNNCQADDNGMPLEMIIGKAYTLIFGGLLGGGPSLTKRGSSGAASNSSEVSQSASGGKEAAAGGNKESMTDYCMMIAMAYETIGTMLQQNLQQKADQSAASTGDIQLQSLVNLKETHKARKKTATWQAALYGSVSACYVAMAWKAETDWKYFAKLGGAVALTGLYMKKASKHAKAAKKVQEVIDSLPKAGDCNPWTGTACFCKETTSKDLYPTEYQEVCVLNQGDAETPKVALGCGTVVDNKLQYDKECKCKETNSCYKANLSAVIPNVGLGNNFMNEANTGFDLLNSGDFDEGKLGTYATGAAAMASKLKPTTAVNTPNVKLTPDQQKTADALKPSLGQFANLAAASPAAGPTSGYMDSPALSKSAVSKLTPAIKEKLAQEISAGYKFGGSGFNSSAKSNNPGFTFPSFGAKPQASNSTEILTFAEQAVNNADVSNAPDTPIFDIISNRYRRSGWTKLQSEETK